MGELLALGAVALLSLKFLFGLLLPVRLARRASACPA